MVFAALKVLVFGVPRQETRTRTNIEQNEGHAGKSNLLKNHAKISFFCFISKLDVEFRT